VKHRLLLFLLLFTSVASADPFEQALLSRGNSHVHTNLVNDQSLRRIQESYLRHVLHVIGKLDPDHLWAEDPWLTRQRAYQLPLDFFLVQDHDSKITPGYWSLVGELAAKYKTRRLEGRRCDVIRGDEWTQGGMIQLKPVPHKAREGEINHIGVFGSTQFPGFSVSQAAAEAGIGVITPDLRSLYSWLLTQPAQSLMCSFNHPSYGSSQFNDFAIPPGMERLVDYFDLIEVGSGSAGFYEGISKLEPFAQRAWQKGWRAMPTMGVDNFGKLSYRYARKHHLALWHLKRSRPFTLFATVLDDLTQAIKRRAGYASEDDDLTVKFWASVEHPDTGEVDLQYTPMGSACLPCYSDFPHFFWKVTETKPEQWKRFELVALKHKTIEAYQVEFGQGRETSVGVTPSSETIGYYLRGEQLDGDRFMTSPVWIRHRSIVETQSSDHPYWGTLKLELGGVKLGGRPDTIVLANTRPFANFSWQKWLAPRGNPLILEFSYAEGQGFRRVMKRERYYSDQAEHSDHRYTFWNGYPGLGFDCSAPIFKPGPQSVEIDCYLTISTQDPKFEETILIEIPFKVAVEAEWQRPE